MILYTITPPEMIYPVEAFQYTSQQTVHVNGVPMIVGSTAGTSEYEVVRIISSDPQHYLLYTPGQKVYM